MGDHSDIDHTGLPGISTGSVATDAIWDAKGDLALGTGANTAGRLAAGANGTVPVYASGESTGMKPAFPPGHEFDYAEGTSAVNISTNTRASATSILASNSVTYDGSTVVYVEFYCDVAYTAADTAEVDITLYLWEDSSDLGIIADVRKPSSPSSTRGGTPIMVRRKLTPSAGAHTYTIKATGTGGIISGGAGGSTAELPMYIRVVKA